MIFLEQPFRYKIFGTENYDNTGNLILNMFFRTSFWEHAITYLSSLNNNEEEIKKQVVQDA